MDADIAQVPTTNPDDFVQQHDCLELKESGERSFKYEDIHDLGVFADDNSEATWNLQLDRVNYAGVNLGGRRSRLSVTHAKNVEIKLEGSDSKVEVTNATRVALRSNALGSTVKLDGVDAAMIDGRDLTLQAFNGRHLGHNCARGEAARYHRIVHCAMHNEVKNNGNTIKNQYIKQLSDSLEDSKQRESEHASPLPYAKSMSDDDVKTSVVSTDHLTDIMKAILLGSSPKVDSNEADAAPSERNQAVNESQVTKETPTVAIVEAEACLRPFRGSGNQLIMEGSHKEEERMLVVSCNLSISSNAPYELVTRESSNESQSPPS